MSRGQDTTDYAVVVDRVSMTFKVPSTRQETFQGLPLSKRAVYRALKRPPSVTVAALQDVSFGVMPGQTLGIIGRNGSGKSTVSQIITGNLAPTSGAVYARGNPMMLGVSAALVPAMSGRRHNQRALLLLPLLCTSQTKQTLRYCFRLLVEVCCLTDAG